MRLDRHRRQEDGIAVITVMLVTVVAGMLVATTVAYALSSQGQSRRDQDYNAALPAAEAGVDDYLTRLNNDAGYVQFSSASPDPDNPAFREFVDVGTSDDGEFRYTVDNASYGQNGTLTVTSTGRTRGVERTVRTVLRRSGFLDFLYFTDKETTDPARYTGGSSFTTDEALQYCNFHYYGGFGARRDVAGRSDYTGDSDSKNCADIQFANGDVINGPLHTNDALVLNPAGTGPRFLGPVTTSWPGTEPVPYPTTGNPPVSQRWRRSGGGSSMPSFQRAGDPNRNPPIPGDPTYAVTQKIPASNLALQEEARTNGCLFTGPTRIEFKDNGTMDVTSPFTKSTRCWTGPRSDARRTGIPIPSSGVIYVQNVPGVSTPPDPNYSSGSCPYDNASGRTHPLSFLNSNDVTAYGCKTGDAFVEGTIDGQATVGAANDVIVTWHLRYDGGLTGNDLLGLIPVNNIWVYHPVDDDGDNLDVKDDDPFRDPEIQAAMLTLLHSFAVQHHDEGAQLGTLSVDGSIAQTFRGPVGTTGGTGYLKDYVYDSRLKFLAPPKFLEPVDAPWVVSTWEER